MATSVVQVRVDDELKTQATALFEEHGLDLSTAIRMFMEAFRAPEGDSVQHDAPK